MIVGGRWGAVVLMIALQLPGAQLQDSRSGLVVGQVIDAATKRPIAGARIALNGPPAANRQPWPPVLTGTDGRFVFRDMARGNYNITAVKAGYVDGAYGRTRPGGSALPLSMNDGERRDDVVVRLWRHAAISGAVRDESGEAQVGVQIRAYRRAVVGGRRRFVPAGSASTDDRGIYRIGTLTPGDYIVGTAPRQMSVPLSSVRGASPGRGREMGAEIVGAGGALVVREGAYLLGRGAATPPPPNNGRLSVYPPTYHPSAPAGEASSIIAVEPGQEYDGADIQIAPVTTASVSGFLIGPDGPVTATPLRLIAAASLELPADGDGLSTLTDRQGGFVFPAVPAGQYALRLTRVQVSAPRRGEPEPAMVWLDLPLTVGSEDIENLGVTAHGGLRIRGRFEFEGDPSRPRGALQNVQISIESADAAPGTPARPIIAHASTLGEFVSPQIPGGRYYVRIADSPSGWMFKSATSEGRDVADTPITLASDTPNVTITFTDRWSGIKGRVQMDRPVDAAVIVFPVETDTWGSAGLLPRRLRMSRLSLAGDYSFNLPAGDYYVVAIPDEQAADWQDVTFLEEASRDAVRVRVAEGERKVQDVRLRVRR